MGQSCPAESIHLDVLIAVKIPYSDIHAFGIVLRENCTDTFDLRSRSNDERGVYGRRDVRPDHKALVRKASACVIRVAGAASIHTPKPWLIIGLLKSYSNV